MGSTRPRPSEIEVVATTMSGSVQDQRKVGKLEPSFRAHGAIGTRVHIARTHAEARDVAHRLVSEGARTIVSAGGAGTFNAVLEGAHLAGQVPENLRLAFLRKGSADLVGKALGISNALDEAVAQIVDGIANERMIPADVIAVEAVEPQGTTQVRHLIGFGGFGVFGEIPRFTETRVVKLYKGLLGSLFGDLGPFYAGLLLASAWWQTRFVLRRVPKLALTFNEEEHLPAANWGAVILMNGDLGRSFPLGRGMSLASGDFRIIAMRYGGPFRAISQMNASRTGRILDNPERYDALIRNVHTLTVSANRPCSYMVNVDGLPMLTRGPVRVSISGRVQLIHARPSPVSEE